ncbi:MAG: hypothetical protein ACKOX6_13555, partial [Bdellovibrio sp.]
MILGLFLIVGCSDASPTVSYLKSIDKFDFSPTNVTTADLSSVSLRATCTSFLDRIDISFDGNTWIPSNTYDSHSKSSCTGGNYSISISNQTSPLNGMNIKSGETFPVQFRAFSRAGYYVYRTVQIKYSPSATIPQAVLAGAKTSQSSEFMLKGRALASQQTTASGSGLILRGRITR